MLTHSMVHGSMSKWRKHKGECQKDEYLKAKTKKAKEKKAKAVCVRLKETRTGMLEVSKRGVSYIIGNVTPGADQCSH